MPKSVVVTPLLQLFRVLHQTLPSLLDSYGSAYGWSVPQPCRLPVGGGHLT